MSKTVNIYEAKAKLSQLIKEVEKKGDAVIICRNGKPVVDLVLHKENSDPLLRDPTLAGAYFTGDPCEGVSEEDWPADFR